MASWLLVQPLTPSAWPILFRPLASVLEILADTVAIGPSARELTLLGKPIERRIILRCCGRTGRQHRSNLGRIDQPVAAYPNAVFGAGEVGDKIEPLFIGDHDLDKLGGQVGRFCDHPDAGLRSIAAGDHPAQIVIVNADLLGTQPGRPGGQKQGNARYP